MTVIVSVALLLPVFGSWVSASTEPVLLISPSVLGTTTIDAVTGKVKWYEKAVGKGSVCMADGMLYVFGEKGGKAGLLVCSPEATELRGQFSVEGSGPSWAHPVVIGGRLYLRYADNLYCFNIKGG